MSLYSTIGACMHFIWQQMREIARWKKRGSKRDRLIEEDSFWSFSRKRWADVGKRQKEENRDYCCLLWRFGALNKVYRAAFYPLSPFLCLSSPSVVRTATTILNLQLYQFICSFSFKANDLISNLTDLFWSEFYIKYLRGTKISHR